MSYPTCTKTKKKPALIYGPEKEGGRTCTRQSTGEKRQSLRKYTGPERKEKKKGVSNLSQHTHKKVKKQGGRPSKITRCSARGGERNSTGWGPLLSQEREGTGPHRHLAKEKGHPEKERDVDNHQFERGNKVQGRRGTFTTQKFLRPPY